MKELYSQFTEDELWLIKEMGFERSLQNIREAQLALGNGYFATRAVLEEIPYDAMPGTYIAGVYDKLTAQVAELVNLPNPFNFRFTVNGEKIDVIAMDVLKHKRILNMKKGLLIRHTVYRDSKKRRYDYQSLRFVSMHNKNIGVMQVVLTPLDETCWVDIHTGIDTSIWNIGVLTEGRKRHFRVRELGQQQNAGYLIIETLEKKHTIIYWSGFYYETGNKKVYAKDNIFQLKIKKGQSVIFTKVFLIERFPYTKDPSKYKEKAFKKFYRAFHAKFEKLLKDHIKAWERLWERADILIVGTANLQQNLRFNIYHMLICANYDDGFSSIGARTLTGEGYRGHIFWDAEIFVMPFYLFVFPEVAKNFLLYRYRRLDAARQNARRNGYRGAMFPWESADTGEEETPTWAKDIDGSIVKIYTHKMEHHITADVAYAVYKYYSVTGDDEFMRKYGYEMLFECARFWASRVEYNKREKVYEINHVIGPDEFHIDVNNNAYTNLMAKWNLVTAVKMYNRLKREEPSLLEDLRQRIKLKEEEVKEWRAIASMIKMPQMKERVIEQFDGYFDLKEVFIKERDENGIPILPPKLKTKDLNKTQLVKQADVLMLVHLLPGLFSRRTKEANYQYYLPRTVHKSSLSPPIHSIIACECGDLHTAYNLFNVALRADISNLYGNTREGIHAASLGGTWQAVIFGFAGISIKRERLCVNPRMPRTWRKMIFTLNWRGDLVNFELTNEVVKLEAVSSKRKSLIIEVFGEVREVPTNKVCEFKRRPSRAPLIAYYY